MSADSDWKALYEAAQRQRLHWSTMITTLMGFVISANVLVWVYAFSNYIPSLKGTIPQQPIYIFIGAIASAISLGLWRIYTHYLDDHIIRLYPEIIFYEAKLGALDNYGLGGYLVSEIHIERIINKGILPEKQSEAIRKLVERRLIGDRKQRWFDIAVIIVIFLLIVLCLIAEAVTGQFFTSTYWWVHLICMILVLLGLVFSFYALHISPKNPSANDIDKVIRDIGEREPGSNQMQGIFEKGASEMKVKIWEFIKRYTILAILLLIGIVAGTLAMTQLKQPENAGYSALIIALLGFFFTIFLETIRQINERVKGRVAILSQLKLELTQNRTAITSILDIEREAPNSANPAPLRVSSWPVATSSPYFPWLKDNTNDKLISVYGRLDAANYYAEIYKNLTYSPSETTYEADKGSMKARQTILSNYKSSFNAD